MTLPLTIIGGYLGAGKTTLVNHVLRHADGLRIAVLVNEFGALPIDEDLIEARDEDMISIAGGCVCCSYGNDLVMALMRLSTLDPRPQHVLLEASGVALPGAIAANVSLLQEYKLDGVLVLANAETILEQANDTYVGDTITRQLADADIVILNKSDLIDAPTRRTLHTWFHDREYEVEVVDAVHGALPREVVLDSFASPKPRSSPDTARGRHPFTSYALDVPHRVAADRLAQALAAPDLGLIRAKGFVCDHAGEMQSIQTVGRRWDVQAAADAATPGLVVIGLSNELDRARIEATIAEVSELTQRSPA